MDKSKIRNFSIIAHIDHGKSTLADRMLEETQSVALRDMENQILDNMELERERGITIKAHAVTLGYTAKSGEEYIFNLIDTPGHVDFNYEVSRSLAACEGAVLVVDSSQGIEAQTLANTYLAIDAGLEILPVLNKIDLPSADPERVVHEIEDIIGIPAEDAPRISAKTGLNIGEVMERIVTDIPAPAGDDNKPLQALIFDSYYDAYKGVIVYVRIKEGKVKSGDTIKMMATGAEFDVVECGYMQATSLLPKNELCAGEVGYITASIKDVRLTQVGDTVTLAENPATEPLATTLNPSVGANVNPCASWRKHTQRISEASSFNEKYKCPDEYRLKPDISPFIAMRFSIGSNASRPLTYSFSCVTDKTRSAMPPRRQKRIGQEHSYRHRADAAGHGRYIARLPLRLFEIDVALQFAVHARSPDVYYNSARLYHIACNKFGPANRGDEYIRAARYLG